MVRTNFGTEAPGPELTRRVNALLGVLESTETASALGVSETTVLRVALGREVHRSTITKIKKCIDAAEQRAESKWLESMRKKTRARSIRRPK